MYDSLLLLLLILYCAAQQINCSAHKILHHNLWFHLKKQKTLL